MSNFAAAPDNAKITSVAISPDGRTVATADDRGIVRTYDWATRALIAEADTGSFSSFDNILVFSPDGSVLAAGGEDSDTNLTPLHLC